MPDLLINYCPRCGQQLKESVLASDKNPSHYISKHIDNGGDWICSNCKCHIEAHILKESDYKLKEG